MAKSLATYEPMSVLKVLIPKNPSFYESCISPVVVNPLSPRSDIQEKQEELNFNHNTFVYPDLDLIYYLESNLDPYALSYDSEEEVEKLIASSENLLSGVNTDDGPA